MHGDTFNLRTGAVTGAPATEPIEVFRLTIEEDQAYIEV
jgi:nitrite reductase/ring-hydroxylating ferredoxin subunit